MFSYSANLSMENVLQPRGWSQTPNGKTTHKAKHDKGIAKRADLYQEVAVSLALIIYEMPRTSRKPINNDTKNCQKI